MLPRCYAPHIHNGGKAISFYCHDTQQFQLLQEADNRLSVAVPFLSQFKGRHTSLSLHEWRGYATLGIGGIGCCRVVKQSAKTLHSVDASLAATEKIQLFVRQ